MRFRQIGGRLVVGRLLDAGLVVLIGVGLGAAILLQLATLSGRTVVVIVGGSMSPAIPIGSLAMIESVTPAHPIEIGDVVTIRLDAAHAVVSHRVVRLTDRAGAAWLELRGDANADSDPVLVPATAVVGRIAMVWPELGRWLGAFASRAGFLTVVGLAGTLYALSLLAARMDATGTPRRSGPIGPAARPAS
jgi:signal peptidase